MKTTEYLDAVKAKLALPSDYAIAKALGVSQQTVTQYRNGRTAMGIEVSIRVGEVLGIDSHKVYADGQVERAKNDDQSAFWKGISEKFSVSFRNLLPGCSPHAA